MRNTAKVMRDKSKRIKILKLKRIPKVKDNRKASLPLVISIIAPPKEKTILTLKTGHMIVTYGTKITELTRIRKINLKTVQRMSLRVSFNYHLF